MNDPYIVLGVSRDSSDEVIKEAYRKLAKKYHPDNYQDSPLSDLASEKMKEINEAYDVITDERKHKGSGNPYQGQNYSYANNGSTQYANVRNLIMSGKLAEAEQILNAVPANEHSAEWFFLKGTISLRKGWLEDAYNNISTACNMDPNNMEYRAAFNQINGQRGGVYGGYNTNPRPQGAGGCSGCDVCSSLICADCCCEAMGGNLIPCC